MGQPSSCTTLSELYKVSNLILCRMYSGESNLGGVKYKKCKPEMTRANSESKEPKFEPTEVSAKRLRDGAPLEHY